LFIVISGWELLISHIAIALEVPMWRSFFADPLQTVT
jgi:hypothetical protein